MEVANRPETGEVLVKVDRGLYEPDAVIKAAHKFTGRWFFRIEQISEAVIGVIFKPKDNNHQEAENLVDLFLNELVDQQVRVLVQRECGQIREQIVKKAFSPIE